MSSRKRKKKKYIDNKTAWAWIITTLLIIGGAFFVQFSSSFNDQITANVTEVTVQCWREEFYGGNQTPCGYNVWEYEWGCIGTVCYGTPITNAQPPFSCNDSSNGFDVCQANQWCRECCRRRDFQWPEPRPCPAGLSGTPGWGGCIANVCYGPEVGNNQNEVDPDPTDVDGGEQCEDGYSAINNSCMRACYRFDFYDLSSECSQEQFLYDWGCIGPICYGTPRSKSLYGNNLCEKGMVNWGGGCVPINSAEGQRVQRLGRLCFAIQEECDDKNNELACNMLNSYCK